MNGNEKIYVSSYMAMTAEDSYTKGEFGDSKISWTNKDLPVEGGFNSIEEALKQVCEVNCFDYKKENWINWAKEYGDEYGRFDFQTMVDENNCEASTFEIERWKEGEKRLWSCTLFVYLEIRDKRELTCEECGEF